MEIIPGTSALKDINITRSLMVYAKEVNPNLTYKQIAIMFDTNENTVKTHFRRHKENKINASSDIMIITGIIREIDKMGQKFQNETETAITPEIAQNETIEKRDTITLRNKKTRLPDDKDLIPTLTINEAFDKVTRTRYTLEEFKKLSRKEMQKITDSKSPDKKRMVKQYRKKLKEKEKEAGKKKNPNGLL